MKQIIDSELFTFENNKKGLRKKDIRENLKKFYELNNTKSFSQKNYDNWPGRICTSGNIYRVYGSWEKALNDAEIKNKKKDEYSIEELVVYVERVWRWAERKPTTGDFLDYNKKFGTNVNRNIWTRKFKSYDNFIINFVKLKQNEISFTEFLSLVKSKKNRRVISLKLRSVVLKRDNYTCQHCGISVKQGAKLHVDHIKPLSKNGPNSLLNLQTLCADCNLGKSNKFSG